MKKVFFVTVLLLLANYGFNKFRLLKKITYEIVGLDVTSRILQSIVVIKIQFNNITDVTATINDLITDIYYNSNYVGLATLQQPFTIPANGSVVASVNFEVSNFDLLTSILAALKNKSGNIKFVGIFSIDKLKRLPFDYEYKLN